MQRLLKYRRLLLSVALLLACIGAGMMQAVVHAAAPGIPTGFTAVAGDTEVLLYWQAPASGDAPTRYEYQYRNHTDGGAWTGYVSTGSAATSFTHTGLTNGKEYRYHVRACNGDGCGTAAPNAAPWWVTATPASGNTLPTTPGAPTNLSATGGANQIALSWTAPASNGGLSITGYQYQQDGGNWQGAGTGTTYTVTGLGDGASHTYKVRAVNALGGGTASGSATASTLNAGLSAPTPSVDRIRQNSARVSWTAVAHATSYDLRYKKQVDATWTTKTGLTGSARGLNNLDSGTGYEVQLRSMASGYKTGAWSASTDFTTEYPPLSAPTPTVGSITANGASVSWTAVTNATSYDLRFRKQGYSWTTRQGVTSPYSLSGLNANVDYEVQLRSMATDYANGTWSASTDFTTLKHAALSAPTPSVGSITASGASVSWSAVANATSYDLRFKKQADSTWTTRTGVTSSYSLSGLDAGTAYEVQLRSMAGGYEDGAWSSSADFTTLPNAPGPPTNLTASGGDRQVTLSWSAPASGGAATRYEYRVRDHSLLSPWSDFVSVGNALTVTVTQWPGVAPGKAAYNFANSSEYRFRVRACNTGGCSADAPGGSPNYVSGFTWTVPSAPTNLLVQGVPYYLALSWGAPASNGGSPITGYEVQQDGGDWIPTGRAETGYTAAAEGGRSYSFRVRAVNAIGSGPATAAQSAVVPAPTATPVTPPDTPTPAPTPAIVNLGQIVVTVGSSADEATYGYSASPSYGSLLTGTWPQGLFDFASAADEGPLTVSAITENNAGRWSFTFSSSHTVTWKDAAGLDRIMAEISFDNSDRVEVALSQGTAAGSTLTLDSPYRSRIMPQYSGSNLNINIYRVSPPPAPFEPSGADTGAPGAPTNLTAEKGNRQAVLSWTAPASQGASPVTRYEYQYQNRAGGGPRVPWVSVWGTNTGYIVPGLDGAESYRFWVRACNAQGCSGAAPEKGTPEWTLQQTPGGPYVAQILITLLASLGILAFYPSKRAEKQYVILGTMLLAPWVPAAFNYGTEMLSVIIGLVGMMAWSAWRLLARPVR